LEGISEGWPGFNDWLGVHETLFFSPDGTRLANGSRLWIIDEGKRIQLPWGEKVLGFNKDGEFIYTLRRQWWLTQRYTSDLALKYQIQLEYPTDSFYSYTSNDLAWYEMHNWKISLDQKIIGAMTYMSPYLFWDIETGRRIDSDEMYYWPYSIYSNDGLFYGVREGYSLVVVNEKQANGSYKEILTIETQGDFSFCLDHILIVKSGDSFDSFDLYDLTKRQLVGSINTEYPFISNWTISPDGTLLAIIEGYYNTLSLWEIKEQSLLVEIEAHFEDPHDIAFSPDGRYLATSSWDGTVRLWGIAP
jgi:WD40 repeat protein